MAFRAHLTLGQLIALPGRELNPGVDGWKCSLCSSFSPFHGHGSLAEKALNSEGLWDHLSFGRERILLPVLAVSCSYKVLLALMRTG